GALYRAGRLTDDQATRLADLDRALLEQAPDVEIAYGPSLTQLVNRLFDSGSPLLEAQGTVRLEIPIQALPSLAQVLADHN
ncbi:MAG TPA: hypothetical protein VER55_07550, partial [Ardenticatenaceae bacterium]|nr:hypothetical protein [Ardenticatenaceae bacterium]